MRNLIGKDMCVSLKIADFKKEFMLEPLIHASAIITDENDVGKYVDEAANFKAIITGDAITINRKNRVPVAFRPRMLQVQCINEMPQFRDKSESLYRRQLIIEFKKSFTGLERKYIKHDYMSRKEVLEYVLYKVLHMDYTEIKETPSMKAAMEKYKLSNEPVRDFLDEVLGETNLGFLPQSFLWDAFKAWSKMNNPHGTIPKRNRFMEEMRDIMENNADWEYHANPIHAGSLLYRVEPLLQKYGLREWTDQFPRDKYVSLNKCSKKHRGYKRVSTVPITAAPTGNTDCGSDTEDKTS